VHCHLLTPLTAEVRLKRSLLLLLLLLFLALAGLGRFGWAFGCHGDWQLYLHVLLAQCSRQAADVACLLAAAAADGSSITAAAVAAAAAAVRLLGAAVAAGVTCTQTMQTSIALLCFSML
jgi:hypothetical protein